MEIGCENRKWRAGNIRPAGKVSEDRKKVRKEKERDHWAWKAGRRGGRTLPGAG